MACSDYFVVDNMAFMGAVNNTSCVDSPQLTFGVMSSSSTELCTGTTKQKTSRNWKTDKKYFLKGHTAGTNVNHNQMTLYHLKSYRLVLCRS